MLERRKKNIKRSLKYIEKLLKELTFFIKDNKLNPHLLSYIAELKQETQVLRRAVWRGDN